MAIKARRVSFCVIEKAVGRRDALLSLYDDGLLGIEIGACVAGAFIPFGEDDNNGRIWLPGRELDALRDPATGRWNKRLGRRLVKVHNAVDKFVTEGDLLIG